MKDWEMTEELKPVPALPKDTGLISKAPTSADNILELHILGFLDLFFLHAFLSFHINKKKDRKLKSATQGKIIYSHLANLYLACSLFSLNLVVRLCKNNYPNVLPRHIKEPSK